MLGGLAGWCWILRGQHVVQRLDWLQVGWMGLSAGCLTAWILLATTPRAAVGLPPRLSKRVLMVACLLVAVAALAWLRPLLSDEVLRYRFDGRVWLLGLSPYRTSPEAVALLSSDNQDQELRPDALDQAAPHQARTTLNLPVSQAGFVAARTLEYLSSLDGDEELMPPGESAGWRAALLSLPWWRQMTFWRCLLALAYLLLVAELIAWLRYRQLSPWCAAVLAWQPVVVAETLGSGHQDLIGVLFLIASLRRADAGNMRRAAMCLAASAAVKPFALLALPFIIRRAWREDGTELYPPRRSEAPPAGAAAARRLIIWFVATLALLMTPFYDGEALVETWRAASAYFATSGDDAAMSRMLEVMFAGAGASEERMLRVRLAAWTICGLTTLVAGLLAWQRRASPAAAFYSMLLVALLLSPAQAPWLLVWPLAVVPLLRGQAGPAVLVWAGTAALFYTPQGLAGEAISSEAMAWQLAPVGVVGLLEVLLVRRRMARLRSGV